MKIKCCRKTSPFCKKEYDIAKNAIYQNKRRNNGKYRCKLCAIEETHQGSKSHFYKNFNIDHNFFEFIDSEIKAYLLGVIAGDGHVSSKLIEVCANNKDIETLELIQLNMATDVPIKPKHKSSTCSFIQFTSRSMAQDICKHLEIKPGKKSDKISLPKIKKDLLLHFIRGLIDTDGCIDDPAKSSTCPRFFYSSTSKVILNQFKEFANENGINGYICGIKINFVGKNAFKFLNMIYKNSNFYLSRKRKYYDIWKTWKSYEGTILKPSKRKIKRMNKKDE